MISKKYIFSFSHKCQNIESISPPCYRYQEETDILINELCKKEVPNSWQCVHQLLEFMQQLIDLEQLTILPLFPRLARSVLPWIQVGGVARTGLNLLTTMLCQSRSKDIDIYNALNVSINDHMPVSSCNSF